MSSESLNFLGYLSWQKANNLVLAKFHKIFATEILLGTRTPILENIALEGPLIVTRFSTSMIGFHIR
jgi:hypothetical protein